MSIIQKECHFSTPGRKALEITKDIHRIIRDMAIDNGLCHLFLKHTSASLMICENYDVSVREDLERFLNRLVVDGDPLFQHTLEGKDDMPAHIRTILTQTEMMIPIQKGDLALGTWQGIFLYEHRYQGQERSLIVSGLS